MESRLVTYEEIEKRHLNEKMALTASIVRYFIKRQALSIARTVAQMENPRTS